MRVLVTGGAGALGFEVCSSLTAAGHEPVAYDLVPPQDGAAGWFRGDIRDGAAIVEAIRSHDVGAIVHLASLLTLDAKANPRLAVEINSPGMANAPDPARVLGRG